MTAQEWRPPYRQYLTVLDERDAALERAEIAEAKLARIIWWLKMPLLCLAGGVMLAISAALFLIVVYAISSILDM